MAPFTSLSSSRRSPTLCTCFACHSVHTDGTEVPDRATPRTHVRVFSCRRDVERIPNHTSSRVLAQLLKRVELPSYPRNTSFTASRRDARPSSNLASLVIRSRDRPYRQDSAPRAPRTRSLPRRRRTCRWRAQKIPRTEEERPRFTLS